MAIRKWEVPWKRFITKSVFFKRIIYIRFLLDSWKGLLRWSTTLSSVWVTWQIWSIGSISTSKPPNFLDSQQMKRTLKTSISGHQSEVLAAFLYIRACAIQMSQQITFCKSIDLLPWERELLAKEFYLSCKLLDLRWSSCCWLVWWMAYMGLQIV